MKIRCGKCKVVLEYNPNELHKTRPILKCPKCKAINEVPLSEIKKTTIKDKEPLLQDDEQTIIENNTNNNNNEVGWIVVHSEETHTQTYPLFLGVNTIGRKSISKPCDVMIVTDDRLMSRNHCAIEVIKNRRGQYDYVVYEVSATNGTFINASIDKKLSNHDQIYIKDGNTIQMGITKVVLKTKEMAISIDEAQKTVINTNYNKTIIIT